ncbi:MAG: hypothetical protein Fur009_0190 [Candidatus Microgenomates bacterium]
MQKIFLDVNFFIDLTTKRINIDLKTLENNVLYISPLTIHIFVYVYKIKLPNQQLKEFLSLFNIAKIDENIVFNSLEGPTNDFEDNIQLHCASVSGCDLFLTSDKNLLKMKFFGEMKIVERL